MRDKTFSTTGLVLKRVKTGETDRIVTLLTADYGKLVCVAKGVRKLTSSKRAQLEPGNIVKIFLVNTKSLPILTQARGINSFSNQPVSLARIRQLSQLLEIVDRLFVEMDIDAGAYELVIKLRTHLAQENISYRFVTQQLSKLIVILGFPHPSQTKHRSIIDYVAEICERPIRSFDFLKV